MSAAGDTARVLVIGVGHPYRADDGIGLLVAARVAELAHIDVIECHGDLLALIDCWAMADAVVIIDAATAATEPGRIHRLDASCGTLPCEVSLSSTHAVGIAETIALARMLGRLPPRVIVYAVQGACFEPGALMTAEVASAAVALPPVIVAEVVTLRRECFRRSKQGGGVRSETGTACSA